MGTLSALKGPSKLMSLSLPTQGIMLVYDITNEKSFDNIRNWIRNIEEVRGPLCFLSQGYASELGTWGTGGKRRDGPKTPAACLKPSLPQDPHSDV